MSKPDKLYLIGATLRGIIIGILVSIALWKLLLIETGARIFRYQGF